MERAIIYCFQSGKRVEDEQNANKKKWRIRPRWDRISIAVALIALLVYGAVSLVSDLAHSVPNWFQTQQEESLMKNVSNYDQVKVVIGHGETVWGIQKELTPNERDIRYPLYLATELNPGVQLGNVQAGEILIMLKEKSNEDMTANASN